MNVKKQLGLILLVSLIFISLCFINPQFIKKVEFGTNNNYLREDFHLELSANGMALNYTNIWQNATIAYRIFDNVKFDVNASKFSGANSTTMEIEFNDSTIRNYEMDWIPGTQSYTYTYTPEYNAPLGFHNISFIIYDESKVQLNAKTTKTNITLVSNYILYLDDVEYNRNDNVYGELIVNDFGSYNFEWKVTVVDNDSENKSLYSNIFDIGNNLSHFSLNIDDRFVLLNHNYFIKVNISDTLSNKVAATYIPFKVRNSLPQIVESSVQFSKESIKREEECQVDLNITDLDPLTVPENISVSLLITNAQGEELSPINLDNNNDWTFSGTFSINKNQPIGLYQLRIGANDGYGESSYYSDTILVENNFPEIHDYWINGFTTQQQVSINYGNDIIFTFNLSDIEDTKPKYVTVSLLNENSEWYNVTTEYSSGTELIIRTEELISGVWYVYISATDSNGDTTHLTSDYGAGPKEIRIIPDTISGNLPWIALFTGLGLGGIIGIGLAYKLLKSRMLRTQPSRDKRKAIPKKKPIKEKPKKEEKVEEKVEEIQKDEETTTETQRKIKRRLN